MIAAASAMESLTVQLLLSAGFFVAILSVAWLVERFVLNRCGETPRCARTRPLDFNLLSDTLLAAVAVTAATLAASLVCTKISELCGLDLPRQDLILILTSPQTGVGARVAITLFALFEAPLLEEAIFRRFVFRNLMRIGAVGPAAAAVVSGAIFALVHFNVVTFLPLWLLGAALAVIYHRTGRIAVPMTIHFLFNLVNILLLLIFPDMT